MEGTSGDKEEKREYSSSQVAMLDQTEYSPEQLVVH